MLQFEVAQAHTEQLRREAQNRDVIHGRLLGRRWHGLRRLAPRRRHA